MTEDLETLRTIADYQFGADSGSALFPPEAEHSLTHTSSGRPRQIQTADGRVATYGTDGRLRLGLVGGERLQSHTDGYRVVVGDESEPYVREGRNTFSKFVVSADEAIRPRDEVVVEHTDGHLLAVGRAELSGEGMLAFETGMAVKIRDGAEKE